jgi:hypothetical protein
LCRDGLLTLGVMNATKGQVFLPPFAHSTTANGPTKASPLGQY